MHGRIWITFVPRTENAGDCRESSLKKMSRTTDFTYIHADFAKFSRLLTVIAAFPDIACPLVVAAMLFYPNRREFWALSPVSTRPNQIGGKTEDQRTPKDASRARRQESGQLIFVDLRKIQMIKFSTFYTCICSCGDCEPFFGQAYIGHINKMR